MRNTLILAVLLIASLVIGQRAKLVTGMYVDKNGTLSELSPAAYSGTQSSNHIVKTNIFWMFRGGRSAVQLLTTRPHFRLICGQGNIALILLCGPAVQPSDLIIVRLDEKSDHREFHIATRSIFGGRGGFDPKKTTTATAVKRADGSWNVWPVEDLKSGEYLITTGTQPQGFDFGIQPGAK
jgi:hypothetical protein